ncbi:hypothetical protein P879_11830 [Paragonimus westermani]|uniref:Uncharacterized protein n=1 Tax=Paragonimus westermani TaxID=34504 RepID=A0A8T0DG21_9TREM|nr:hypothetical protein P879_11830 [Paragonimus westermani]
MYNFRFRQRPNIQCLHSLLQCFRRLSKCTAVFTHFVLVPQSLFLPVILLVLLGSFVITFSCRSLTTAVTESLLPYLQFFISLEYFLGGVSMFLIFLRDIQ